MPIPFLIPSLISGGATLLSGIIQGIAGSKAAATQAGAAQAGIDVQRQQFDAMQSMLAPYVQAGQGSLGRLQPYEQAGNEALSAQMALTGLGGAQAQQAAISALASSPEMQALTQQGESALLQQASATGGLRGGNVQAALSQFRPQVLSNLINQQYSRLGGLTAMGQNTSMNLAQLGQGAAGTLGTAGMQSGQNISALLQQQAAAQAGGQMALGQAWQSIPNALMAGLGMYQGLGGKF